MNNVSSYLSCLNDVDRAGLKRRIILFAIGSLEVGGAEKQLLELISRLPQRRYRCHVFTLQSGGPLLDPLKLMGATVHLGRVQRRELSRAPWKVLFAQWRLMKVIRETSPHVIHSFLPLVTFMGALAGRVCGIPLVITSRRALGTHQERHRFLRPLDLLANTWSHRVTVNSKAVWNDVAHRDHIDPHKLILIYNAVDPTPYHSARVSRGRVRQALGLKPEEKAVIVIANLIPYKGHSDVLDAAKEVLKKIPKMKLLVVGEDRGFRRQLERQASELGICQAVTFLGGRSDVPDLLAASDLSVLASHEEGFSNVILESMAAGLPIVTTDVGGNAEAVVDGETGWLVPPRDPEALAKRILDLLLCPDKAMEWGEKARSRVRELFTVEKMVEEHLNLYDSAFATRGQG